MGFINDNEAKIENLLCPEYYKNEVNAYSAEIRLNPSVSEKYVLERNYRSFRKQKAGIGETYMFPISPCLFHGLYVNIGVGAY